MICRKCGKTISDDAVFCSYCGERCAKKVCTACGTELREEQLFCHVCGLRWNNGTTPPTEQKTAPPSDRQAVQTTKQQTTQASDCQAVQTAKLQITQASDRQAVQTTKQQITQASDRQAEQTTKQQTTQASDRQAVQTAEQKTAPPPDRQTVQTAEQPTYFIDFNGLRLTTESVALTEEDSFTGKKKMFYIIFGIMYAVFTAALIITGWFGYYDHYYWSEVLDKISRYRVLAAEAPFFWLSVFCVIVGAALHILSLLRLRKGKRVTKVNMAVRIVLMGLAFIFFVLLCYAEGSGLHLML